MPASFRRAAVADLGVSDCRLQLIVPNEALSSPKVVVSFEQLACEPMPGGTAPDSLCGLRHDNCVSYGRGGNWSQTGRLEFLEAGLAGRIGKGPPGREQDA
jgi:hypothetical protein